MKFTQKMVEAVAEEYSRKLQANEVEPVLVIATLFIMEETGKLDPIDVDYVLAHVFPDPFERLRTVLMAGDVLDDQVLQDIIEDEQRRDMPQN